MSGQFQSDDAAERDSTDKAGLARFDDFGEPGSVVYERLIGLRLNPIRQNQLRKDGSLRSEQARIAAESGQQDEWGLCRLRRITRFVIHVWRIGTHRSPLSIGQRQVEITCSPLGVRVPDQTSNCRQVRDQTWPKFRPNPCRQRTSATPVGPTDRRQDKRPRSSAARRQHLLP